MRGHGGALGRVVLLLAVIAGCSGTDSSPGADSNPSNNSAAAAASDPSAVEIPATFQEDRVFVRPVTAAGDTLVFYTDTGGGLNMIYAPAAGELGLPQERVALGPDTVSIMRWPEWSPGQGIPAPEDPTSPEGGALVVMPFAGEAAALQDSTDAGFLGRHLFADRVWTFDYPEERLLHHPEGNLPPHDAAQSVALGFQEDSAGRRTMHFPRIGIVVEGDTLDLLFDTGATMVLSEAGLAALDDGRPARRASSFISSEVFDRWQAAHPEWTVVEGATETGAQLIEVPHVIIADREVGPVWFESRPAGTFEEFMSQWMDEPIVGALGGNVLRFFRVTVDYPGAVALFR